MVDHLSSNPLLKRMSMQAISAGPGEQHPVLCIQFASLDDMHEAVRFIMGMRLVDETSEEFDLMAAVDFAEKIINRVCELPDRNSPEDEPGALVCSPSELEGCIVSALEAEWERRTGRSVIPTPEKATAAPRESDWRCDHCGRDNDPAETHCGHCEWSRKHTIAGVLHERACMGSPCRCGALNGTDAPP